MKVLIADDDKTQCQMLKTLLKRKLGFESIAAADGRECLDCLRDDHDREIGLLILDLSMPVMTGMEVLEVVSEQYVHVPVIVLTGHLGVEHAVKAMRLGASDFLTKPVESERMIVSIQTALRLQALSSALDARERKEKGGFGFGDLIGAEGGLQKAVQMGRKAAQSNIPVLLTGETGVGKEVFAQAIHGESVRGNRAFVAVNCGALPEQLVESILFGHEKGAFTGAIAKTPGKFREAENGTIFLDEIGELPLSMQVKILRVLQQKEIEPVGAANSVPVNVRIISATNKDLAEEVKNGNFREDLYFRLNVLEIEIPPVRERSSDVALLAEHFNSRYAAVESKRLKPFSAKAWDFIKSYSWPGNVRELENAIHRAVVLCDGKEIEAEDFPQSYQKNTAGQYPDLLLGISMFGGDGKLKTLEALEKDALDFALNYCDGNVTKAAQALGIAKSTFYRKRES